MSVRKPGSNSVSLKSSARPEAMRPDQCWSLGSAVRHALRQVEGPHLLAEDFRVEERFGFEGHLFRGRLGRDRKKPSVLAVREKRFWNRKS